MKKKLSFLAILSSFVLFAYSFFASGAQSSSDLMKVVFLDVGQGDATLIQTPYKQNILIDGGPDDSVIKALERNLPWWNKQIDLMILTHPHSDHLDGLLYVLENYKVEQILYTGVLHTTDAYLDWLEIIKNKKIKLKIIDHPQKIILGDNAYLKILYPFESFLNKRVKNLNNTSITCVLQYKANKFFIAGDIEREVEEELLDNYNDLRVDVYKANHHGSKTANSQEFIDALNPESVVFTVSEDNQFDFPHKQIVNRFLKKNINIYRTDKDGDIVFYSDGNSVILKNKF